MAYWLMKSEPDSYSWDDLVRDKATEWDGVRNPQAAINLRAMAVGDRAFFYHSGDEKAAVGIMEIGRTAKPDGPDGKWSSVAVKPVEPLAKPVTLRAMKANSALAEMKMIRQSRLSVSPVSDAEWAAILAMAK
ncbi:EVE domain-containing protein [Flavisphingomonas formosensis]|uniref:EVE domain-containing protein n=1 Tax=Flavisphingomonas formosensis TaxID=861534 RepID=UPI0012F81F23|nr:EVE domain-containing protein [Sphingomonas formosensis]